MAGSTRHLLEPLGEVSLEEARSTLCSAHRYLTQAAIDACANVPSCGIGWGHQWKRLIVKLPMPVDPLVGKEEERFSELVNMLATVEHLLAALKWFSSQTSFSSARVSECHPTTSHGTGVDLVLSSGGGVVARCEVTDIVSRNVWQNKKEKKVLENLGVSPQWNEPHVRRFLATSPEWGDGLNSRSRKWPKHYRYEVHDVTGCPKTRLLEIQPARV